MGNSFIMTTGHPHILLGLLRRMPGIEDISLLLDSKRTLQEFKKCYPEDIISNQIMEEACRLNIISEMAGIINEPNWRKRSFINKSAIRIMTEGRLKEYQMCELLESFMQIFGWEYELPISRRWETSEEDSADYNKEHPRENIYAYIRQNDESVSKSEADKADKNNKSGVEHDSADNQEEVNEADNIRAKQPASTGVERKRTRTEGRRTLSNNRKSSPSHRSNRKSRSNPPYEAERRYVEYDEYDDYNYDYYDYYDEDGRITDIKAYIQNEIVKSGIRFENIMSNAVKRDVRSAIKGNPEAQYRMGAYYAEPDTRHTDYEEALKWYRVSASQGNKKAQFELGMLYDGGKVKCEDYKKEAIKCYIGLAESGFPTAQCMLGMKYRFGDGVDEDINEAIKWFKRAALQGHTDAMRNLGDVYMAIGKRGDAMKWYEKGAAAGDMYCRKMSVH